MARTRTQITFFVNRRAITIKRRPDGLYRIEVKGPNWRVTRDRLGDYKACWFALMAATKLRTHLLRAIPPRTPRSIHVLLEVGFPKTTGVNWIALRMAGGARPIMLKAPALFHHRIIYIEPIPDQEGQFEMRIVDPMTDERTDPITVDRGQVEAAIATYGPND